MSIRGFAVRLSAPQLTTTEQKRYAIHIDATYPRICRAASQHGGAATDLGGVRIRLRSGRLSTVDGPSTETKEVIGGYASLEAKSKAEAVELTKRFLKIHGDEWDIECEVRQLDGPEFGSEA